MSERILQALMQLFAIISRVDGLTNSGRNIVQSFLKQQLNNELVEKYLKVFDEFLESHHAISRKKDGSAKRTSLNSVKVLKICSQINQELEQTQKVIVLIRILEFVNSSTDISEQELEFVSTVANAFNISDKDFLQLKSFVQNELGTMSNSTDFLLVNNESAPSDSPSKHFYCQQFLPGVSLWLLCVQTVDLYFIKLSGSQEMFLNGHILKSGRIYIFNRGSSIRSSKFKPIYYSDLVSKFLADSNLSKITFSASGLYYKFKSGKFGLRDINLREEGGHLVGIMGGSGAGKSTLLNVLNGTEDPSSGEVLINGINIHKEKNKIKGIIGHVSQDDILVEELTVFQNLFFNAKLCFGELSDKEINERVLKLLMDLGLYETRNLKVGSPLEKTISGGQRKRLNIALELIREPSVLFVDEPTSGLSSRDSENIMDLLKELALKGRLVFVVIHQPSSDIYKMFDNMIILDVGGYPVYYGNPVDAVIYFKRLIHHVNSEESECAYCGNVNPEQIFSIIETKVLDEYGHPTQERKHSPAEWNSYFKDIIEKVIEIPDHEKITPKGSFKIPNFIKQWWIFIHRDVMSKIANRQYMLINFLEAPALAFILAYLIRYFNTDKDSFHGYVFSENENLPAFLFMAVVVALFVGLSVSAEEIIKDRKIRKRERFLNLSNNSYLLSKVSIMFLISAIQTITFVIVGNLVLDIKGMWLDYWIVLFSISCFANLLGLNISSAFNSAITIYILIPILIIPQLLLSGVLVKFDKLNPHLTDQSNVPFWGEIMVSRWGFEALAVNQYCNNEYERIFYRFTKKYEQADHKKNYWMDKLNKKINRIQSFIDGSDKKVDIKSDLDLLKNEVEKENSFRKGKYSKLKFNRVNELTLSKGSFKDASLLNELRSWLEGDLKEYYNKEDNHSRDSKDDLVRAVDAKDGESIKKILTNGVSKNNKQFYSVLGDKTNSRLKSYDSLVWLSFKNDYTNEALTNLVRNKNDFGEKFLEKDGRLIQRIDPIFLDPENNFGRAHFFAPQKKVFGMYYPTFWFNVFVIWLMTFALTVTLYLNLLRKVIEFSGNILSRFKNPGKKNKS
ncbi:MAG: ATP-binding cassette domain-containing protein [Bacteroidota bacterium]